MDKDPVDRNLQQSLSQRQSDLFAKICQGVTSPDLLFEYRSEYLGYLPYGYYHGLFCTDKEIQLSDLPDWSLDDLLHLEKSGHLKESHRYVSAEDPKEQTITFRVLLTASDRSTNG